MNENYDDRRRLKRRQLISYPLIIDHTTGEELGRIGDITTEGIMIISDKEIELNRDFEIEIDLTTFQELASANRLSATIRTQWSHLDKNPDLHCTGCKISNSNRKDQGIIDRLIQYYSFND